MSLRDLSIFGGPVKRHPAGYLQEYVGGQTWLLQHRVLIEREIGRPLASREQVHHRNGDRADNRIENLEHHETQRSHAGEHVRHDHAAILRLYAEGLGSEVVAARVGCHPSTVVFVARRAGVLRSRADAAGARPRDSKGHFIARTGT